MTKTPAICKASSIDELFSSSLSPDSDSKSKDNQPVITDEQRLTF